MAETSGGGPRSLELGVLGPLQVRIGGQLVAVPGAKRKAVLAVLALAGGRAVSADTLVDALWPDDPPEDGPQALQSHISRLRATLGPAAERLQRHGAGYRLALDPDAIDAVRARRMVTAARTELAVDPARAVELSTEALALWRGDALTEFADVAPLAADAVGLAELRRDLRDIWLDSRLAAGDTGVAVDAAAASAADPLRESTAMILVRALAAAGRTAEAMQAAGSFRRRLAEETGLDPSADLRDLEQAVAAGQLTSSTIAGSFGSATAPIFGRDHEIEDLHRLLSRYRCVTVWGPGGVGKTRLAMEVAAARVHRHAVRVVWVALAPVTEADRVPAAVMSALGLRVEGVPSVRSVAEALSGQELLLVLDNCEHVVDSCRELVAALTQRVPGVGVLTTSRTILHVPGEYVVRLQPWPLPVTTADLSELARQPAVQAFLDYAERRQPGGLRLTATSADLLVTVIKRLDGLPLAIELAAGQLAVLPLDALHDRLGRALDALQAERPADDARHRTLRATIAWSYSLLSAAEQSLLRALAPFPGGVDLDTIESEARAVAPDAEPLVLLAHLVDASLLSVDVQHSARYLLLDTVRAFLLDELAARDERAAAEDRFLRWAGTTAQNLRDELADDREPKADRRLRAELANLRAARDLARERGELDLRLSIALALTEASMFRDLPELWSWSLEDAVDPAIVGHAREGAVLGGAAVASWLLGDGEGARRFAARGLDLAATAEETWGCWNAIASTALFRAEFDLARSAWERAAATAVYRPGQLAAAALAAGYAGDSAGAQELLSQAREAARQVPSPSALGFVAYASAEVSPDPGQAAVEYTSAVELGKSSGATFVERVARLGLAALQAAQGDHESAARSYLELLDYFQQTGNLTQLWTTVRNVAVLLGDCDRPEPAALLFAAADHARGSSVVAGEQSGRTVVGEQRVHQALASAAMVEIRNRARTMITSEVVRVARTELGEVANGMATSVENRARRRAEEEGADNASPSASDDEVGGLRRAMRERPD